MIGTRPSLLILIQFQLYVMVRSTLRVTKLHVQQHKALTSQHYHIARIRIRLQTESPRKRKLPVTLSEPDDHRLLSADIKKPDMLYE